MHSRIAKADMELPEALKEVAVIGAAGKMGRGIAALLLQEMSLLAAPVEGHTCRLMLIDSNQKAFFSLKEYLHGHILKFAEKNIVRLREIYAKRPDLVSNEEMIQEFVDRSLGMVFVEADLEAAKDCNLIFEAVIEDADLKVKILAELKKLSPGAFFLTNTSSIPISFLNEKAHLEGRIIGYHFYNPPVVQRLLEVVVPEKTEENLKRLAFDLAKRLQKLVVVSHDAAGFIGNGHFIRELVYACELAKELGTVHTYAEAVYILNQVTQDYLLRPMGIFQLADYVGLDVCAAIMSVMGLHQELIDWMIDSGNRGGQDLLGDQKPGFFQYKGHLPIAVYSLESKTYLPLNEGINKLLGTPPELSWKKLQKDPDKKKKLDLYFEELSTSPDLGAEIARKFLRHSREVGRRLVADGVASKIEDVDAVLENGFYHLYGVGEFE